MPADRFDDRTTYFKPVAETAIELISLNAFLPIASLLLSVSLLLIAHGLMGTLLPLRGLVEGYNSLDLGVPGAVFFPGFGISAVVGLRAISRVGHIRTFAAMAAIISITVMPAVTRQRPCILVDYPRFALPN